MIHFFLYLPSRKKSEVMYVVYIGYILIEKKMIHAPLCLKNWCSHPCSEIEKIL